MALNPRLAAAASAVVADPAHLRRSTYTGLVGQDFSMGWWGSSASLRLASVSDLPHLKGRDDAFSLIFVGEAATPATGGEVALSHPKVGKFELFVVPVDRASDPQEYEAIVNRSVGANRRRVPQSGGGDGTRVKKHRRRRKNTVRESHHHHKHLSRRARRRAAKARG